MTASESALTLSKITCSNEGNLGSASVGTGYSDEVTCKDMHVLSKHHFDFSCKNKFFWLIKQLPLSKDAIRGQEILLNFSAIEDG